MMRHFSILIIIMVMWNAGVVDSFVEGALVAAKTAIAETTKAGTYSLFITFSNTYELIAFFGRVRSPSLP